MSNPYHKPAGSPEGGEFTTGPAAGLGADHGKPVDHPVASLDANRINDIVSKAHPNTINRMLEQISKARAKRNWSTLPASFEHDAVKFVFKNLKDHFPKNAISQRVSASKASTFAELEAVIKRIKVRS